MKATALMLGLALLGASCSNTRYRDAQDEETINADFGSTDKQRFVDGVSADFLRSPGLTYYKKPDEKGDTRVIAVMGGIVNETSEHINTEIMTRSLRDKLLGPVRFVGGDLGQAEITKQIRFQQDSGRVDPAKAAAFGKQLGAEVVLYGSLSSIEKGKGRSLETLGSKKRDVYMQFVMNCIDVNTGEILWTEEVELRKQQVTSLFGSS
ncbi:MAG: penicillin-binding protein activator LpoB [Planctomycetota bacterium]|nr:penicillin-binding protein activator LpoB [Planctomycetota bacterium]